MGQGREGSRGQQHEEARSDRRSDIGEHEDCDNPQEELSAIHSPGQRCDDDGGWANRPGVDDGHIAGGALGDRKFRGDQGDQADGHQFCEDEHEGTGC